MILPSSFGSRAAAAGVGAGRTSPAALSLVPPVAGAAATVPAAPALSPDVATSAVESPVLQAARSTEVPRRAASAWRDFMTTMLREEKMR